MKRSLFGSILTVGIALVFAITLPAHAENIDVTCDTAQLITAINTANGNAEADVINLATSCTYNFTSASDLDGGWGDSALPVITSEITINGNGATIQRDSGAANFRVLRITASGTLTLNNLTVSGGNIANYGGGIVNSGWLQLTSSTLSGNHGGTINSGAGGIYNGGTVTFINSTVSGNTTVGAGGGLWNDGAATFTNSIVSGNTAANNGGGIFGSGTLTITDSTFSNNVSTTLNGGGIYSTANPLTVTNSTFTGNTATQGSGGGIINENGGTLTVTDSTFTGNSASSGGGINSGSSATVTNSSFTNNTATVSGGGIHLFPFGSTVTVANSTFSGNSASLGGGLYANTFGTIVVTNSTVSGNTATEGGGIWTSGGLTATNNIVWGNSSQINGTATVSYSIVQGGFTGTGNLDTDPLFVAPVAFGSAPTATGDYHLQFGSPAIDVGNNGAVVGATDIDGDLRIIGGVVDMGSDEFNECVLYASPYTAAASDTPAVIKAIDCANADPDANVINLTNSIYNFTVGDATNSDSALPLISTEITINGNGATLQRDAGAGTDFRLLRVEAAGNLTLIDINISGGRSPSAGVGGGIYNAGGTMTVINSTISGNSADDGGGIFNAGPLGTLTITNSTISGNISSNGGGGGIYNGGSLTVTNSSLSGNNASNSGGGIWNEGSTLTVTNSIVWGNSSQINDLGSSTVTFSIVEGGFSGTGNLDTDPLFVAPVAFTSAPTTAGDYHIQSTSPAIDAGSNAALPADTQDLDNDADTTEAIPFDRDGSARIFNGLVDMGAYEFQGSELLDNGGFEDAGINNGTPVSWVINNDSSDKRKCLNGKALSGDCAFKFTGSLTDNSKLVQTVDLTGHTFETGDTLDFSAFFKGNNATAGIKMILKVNFSDATPVQKTKLTVTQNAAYTNHAAPTLTLTSSAVSKIKVQFKHLSTAGAIYVDDASVLLNPADARRAGANPLPLPVAPGGFRGSN